MAHKEGVVDFTTGSIPRHIINFTVPLFVGNLLQALYNTVDSIWVGKYLGHNALAAVSVSFPIVFIMIAMVTGLTMATTVMVAQYKGAEDDIMVKKTINNTMLILTIAAAIMSAIGIVFHKTILSLIGTPPELFDMASGYLNITFAGLAFVFGYNIVSAILRGLGDSKTPLRFLFYATVINILLDPIFIFGLGPIPKMGINGAALATILAQAIAFFMAIKYLNNSSEVLSIRVKDFKYDKDLTRKLMQIGLPAGLQQTVVALGHTIVMSVVNSFGSSVVAAFGAANKIDSFFFMPSMSIGIATSALTGQNLGARKYKRVNETMKWASLLSVTISAIMILFIYLFPEKPLLLFSNDKEVLKEGSVILKTWSLAYIPFGMMWVSNGIIRGAGDTIITMIMSIFSLWLVRIPLAIYLSRYTALGSRGIWVAMAISMTLSGVMSLIYYRTGRWKRSIFAVKSNP